MHTAETNKWACSAISKTVLTIGERHRVVESEHLVLSKYQARSYTYKTEEWQKSGNIRLSYYRQFILWGFTLNAGSYYAN